MIRYARGTNASLSDHLAGWTRCSAGIGASRPADLRVARRSHRADGRKTSQAASPTSWNTPIAWQAWSPRWKAQKSATAVARAAPFRHGESTSNGPTISTHLTAKESGPISAVWERSQRPAAVVYISSPSVYQSAVPSNHSDPVFFRPVIT